MPPKDKTPKTVTSVDGESYHRVVEENCNLRAERDAALLQIQELRNALNGLMGLVQLIQSRADLPEDLHRNLTTNHRYQEAMRLSEPCDGTWGNPPVTHCNQRKGHEGKHSDGQGVWGIPEKQVCDCGVEANRSRAPHAINCAVKQKCAHEWTPGVGAEDLCTKCGVTEKRSQEPPKNEEYQEHARAGLCWCSKFHDMGA